MKRDQSLEVRLSNYKSMQQKTAKTKGVLEELNRARTLTEARKIVYGYKKKNTKARKQE